VAIKKMARTELEKSMHSAEWFVASVNTLRDFLNCWVSLDKKFYGHVLYLGMGKTTFPHDDHLKHLHKQFLLISSEYSRDVLNRAKALGSAPRFDDIAKLEQTKITYVRELLDIFRELDAFPDYVTRYQELIEEHVHGYKEIAQDAKRVADNYSFIKKALLAFEENLKALAKALERGNDANAQKHRHSAQEEFEKLTRVMLDTLGMNIESQKRVGRKPSERRGRIVSQDILERELILRIRPHLEMLNSPTKNIGVQQIEKEERELINWYNRVIERKEYFFEKDLSQFTQQWNTLNAKQTLAFEDITQLLKKISNLNTLSFGDKFTSLGQFGAGNVIDRFVAYYMELYARIYDHIKTLKRITLVGAIRTKEEFEQVVLFLDQFLEQTEHAFTQQPAELDEFIKNLQQA